MRIPNSFVTRFTQASDLKLACVFYSLIHKNTKRNLLGYEITVKQTTLVSLCGFSVSTVKRAASSLLKSGFIKFMQCAVSWLTAHTRTFFKAIMIYLSF